ncbi:hypothetical protein [Paenibacillus tianmuensis]|nr:hypothetical protein [Paenibacillus tianmuensis]
MPGSSEGSGADSILGYTAGVYHQNAHHSKLGVSGRIEAVEKARKMGLH